MALLHRAELRPSKLELLAGWLPGRQWFAGEAGAPVSRVAAYRFDDPAGEVGIETLLVRAGDGPVLQVPLTYRGAPLAGADEHLVGVVEHSVLGRRWAYDACGDPVYPPLLAAAVLADAGQAEEYFEVDGKREVRPASMTLVGSRTGRPVPTGPASVGSVSAGSAAAGSGDGGVTVVRVGDVELAVVRRPVPAEVPDSGGLTGTWPGQDEPVLLAYAR
ncbi:CG0192-related protein [Micromonospora aurantiaca (nom. illeg.)]|uniref:CG0192-related protein n=1 Tax=Micromonospora aurantiaca (nom. illeg.) TaxID=47850 RepID=UPI0033C512ED